MRIDGAIERARRFAEWKGWSPARYAREAGLSVNGLSGFYRPGWNPTVETLRKLEALIPADFDLAMAEAGRAAE